MGYKLWRQAYYGIDGRLRPAAVIMEDVNEEAALVRLAVDHYMNFKYSDYGNTYYGLEIYDTEEEANKEPFNINNYGK